MTVGRGERPRAKRGEGEALRGEILAAANALIAEQRGDTDLSLRSVARRTGVTPMMLYRHFANLAEILDEVQRDHYLRLVEVLREAAKAGGLPAFADAFVDYGLANPGYYRLMFAIPLDPERAVAPDKPVLGLPALELLVTTVTGHLEVSGSVRDPWRASIQLWTALHGIVHLRLSVGMRGAYSWPPVRDQVADALAALRD
ncbi:WHG domain-containing protein [Nocardia takedensis]